MSDIPVVEIVTKKALTSVNSPSTSAKALSIRDADATPRQKGEWLRTRFCYCPDSAATDCRFHSQKEPGWASCPWEKKSGKANGRWLWARHSHSLVSDEELSVGADIKELTKAQQHAADAYL